MDAAHPTPARDSGAHRRVDPDWRPTLLASTPGDFTRAGGSAFGEQAA